MKNLLLLAGTALFACAALPADARDMWTKEQANSWYAKQPWMVGANYNNRSAINQFEMWQADTFNPAEIDQEFGWAAGMGMNIMRVYLHNMLWEEDAPGLKKRMEQFLQIADKHKIRIMFVLFDSCWDPNPRSGPQRPPIPGVHNSGWMQAPGAARLADKSQYGKLEAYVKDIVGSFANDKRIAVWDVWNEPNNSGGGMGYYPLTPNKTALVAGLLGPVFDWARSVDPTQPLTSGLWTGGRWDQIDKLDAVEKIQVTQSDVMSFHDYRWPEHFEERARQIMTWGRPVLVTEYMARGNGSLFDTILPLGKKHNMAMIHWGFVDGKSQTRIPWDSWRRPYNADQPPTVWFHDVLRTDGTPYRKAEVDLIKRLTTEANGSRK
ncbi:cellulase family glycosylhydrolase [Sphingomonas sp. G-3-2-10]|uniref:cellulase family glycosylhydrolase n=1 Tax=Sphingomonas sp. G-3-2-10 TaxID=2728838 RepID=UPI00146B3768|nr:cellulase family glycosylhydrolase [Sphingomonas sp. G-3-2-10]NML07809.1 cellulase family glycosylhydrolase [Sphingomonas sp. G-3-2-10]